jgi:hypothetical protein
MHMSAKHERYRKSEGGEERKSSSVLSACATTTKKANPGLFLERLFECLTRLDRSEVVTVARTTNRQSQKTDFCVKIACNQVDRIRAGKGRKWAAKLQLIDKEIMNLHE